MEWGRLCFSKVGCDFGRYVERVALADTCISCVWWCVRCRLGYSRTWSRAVSIGPVISEQQVSVAANGGSVRGRGSAQRTESKMLR